MSKKILLSFFLFIASYLFLSTNFVFAVSCGDLEYSALATGSWDKERNSPCRPIKNCMPCGGERSPAIPFDGVCIIEDKLASGEVESETTSFCSSSLNHNKSFCVKIETSKNPECSGSKVSNKDCSEITSDRECPLNTSVSEGKCFWNLGDSKCHGSYNICNSCENISIDVYGSNYTDICKLCSNTCKLTGSTCSAIIVNGIDPRGIDVLNFQNSKDSMNYAFSDANINNVLGKTVVNSIKFFLGFLSLASFGLIMYAGIKLITSQGKKEEMGKTWKMMQWATIGVLIIIFSYALVSFLLDNMSKILLK